MPKLTIVRGVPGSGKSTYAKSLGIFHVEADMYFQRNGKYDWYPDAVKQAHAWCKAMVEIAIDGAVDLVVSNTFVKRWEMQWYFDIANAHNYQIEIINMQGNYGSIHNVPQETIDRMKANFEE